jgi:HK97 family phage major capsid protein
MKLKLLKAYKPADSEELPVGSVIEMEDDACKALVEDGTACEYTDAAATAEQTDAVKALQLQLATQTQELATKQAKLSALEQELAKQEKPMSMQIIVPKQLKDMTREDRLKAYEADEDIVGKAVQYLACKEYREDPKVQNLIATKAVVGMSEGTMADGGDLVTTAVSRIMGQVYADSEFLNKCTKLTLPDQANSMRVTYEASDWWNGSSAPLAGMASEGDSMTPTKLAFGATDVYPRNPNILAVVTAELLEDVTGLGSEVTRVMGMKMTKIMEGKCFLGNGGSGTDGFVGILATSGSAQVARQTISTLGTPTLAEIQGFVAQIVPAWRKKSQWYMSNAYWQTLRGSTAFVSAANINQQVIDLDKDLLLGYPVSIVEALPASTPIVFGDASQYTLVQGRNGQIMLFSKELYFSTNQLAWRLTQRMGGAIAAAKYTLADSSTVAAFCKFSNSGS